MMIYRNSYIVLDHLLTSLTTSYLFGESSAAWPRVGLGFYARRSLLWLLPLIQPINLSDMISGCLIIAYCRHLQLTFAIPDVEELP